MSSVKTKHYSLLAVLSIFTTLLLYVPVLGETLDVTIKGFDDGLKTNRQQDYKEAVLDAKRQAIEQAGVTVESKSTVRNSVLQEDFIETQAKAVLLPGFQIMDIGYMQDGTYQVVLSGKVQVQPKPQPAEGDSGALLLLMDIYSVPITFQLDNKPLDAAGKFAALVPLKDTVGLMAFTGIREVKRSYNKLPQYFVYLLKLPAGKHSIKITASIIGGSGPEKDGNRVEAEVPSGKALIYEYRADPEYTFAAADTAFLFQQFLNGNRFKDTTAVYRNTIKNELIRKYQELTGFNF
jgi:hypothetical protein